MQPADLFERDVSPAEIARQVGCRTRSCRTGGKRCGRVVLRRWAAAGRGGRKPKLSGERLAVVEDALIRGAEAHGYANALLTLPRVAEVIARVTGVAYHTSGICSAISWTGPGSQPDGSSSSSSSSLRDEANLVAAGFRQFRAR
jgi:hypothetical protein